MRPSGAATSWVVGADAHLYDDLDAAAIPALLGSCFDGDNVDAQACTSSSSPRSHGSSIPHLSSQGNAHQYSSYGGGYHYTRVVVQQKRLISQMEGWCYHWKCWRNYKAYPTSFRGKDPSNKGHGCSTRVTDKIG
ncbi:hypothetical protein VPH35_069273 [Triticum aestivum]|uniref:Uncharacterized protein n=1 Tax=Triticum urartu TaxID=4572 RepID=A0A8R7UBJ7_TRIUA